MPAFPSTRCADIPRTPVDWLWKPYLARGKLAVLDGDPGTGKSFVALDIAARISRGGFFPDGQNLDRPHVTLLLNAEDDAADTILPRLAATGGDLANIHVVSTPRLGDAALPQFPDDLPALEATIRERRADLVVIDPMPPFFPRQVWMNNDQSIRKALTPFAALAAATGCAILFIRHLSKLGGAKAIYRGSGSIGILGAMRTGLLLAPHPDDPDLRVLAMSKSNLSRHAPSLGFRLVERHGEPGVQWTGPIDLSANDLCLPTPADTRTRPRDRAKEWLKEQLKDGRRKAAEIEEAASKAGIAEATLKRAKQDLKVESELVWEGEKREWFWFNADEVRSKYESPLPPLEESLPPLRSRGKRGNGA